MFKEQPIFGVGAGGSSSTTSDRAQLVRAHARESARRDVPVLVDPLPVDEDAGRRLRDLQHAPGRPPCRSGAWRSWRRVGHPVPDQHAVVRLPLVLWLFRARRACTPRSVTTCRVPGPVRVEGRRPRRRGCVTYAFVCCHVPALQGHDLRPLVGLLLLGGGFFGAAGFAAAWRGFAAACGRLGGGRLGGRLGAGALAVALATGALATGAGAGFAGAGFAVRVRRRRRCGLVAGTARGRRGAGVGSAGPGRRRLPATGLAGTRIGLLGVATASPDAAGSPRRGARRLIVVGVLASMAAMASTSSSST